MRQVPIEELRSGSSRFDIFRETPPTDPAFLRSGTLVPIPVSSGEVVWGFGVIEAAYAEGVDTLYCLEGAWNPGEMLLLALKLENRTGSYNLEEQAAVAALAGELDLGPELDEISRAVTGNSGFFPRIERFRTLPDFLKPHAISGRLDLKTAQRVRDLPSNVFDIACGYSGFSHSELRIFLGHLYEISMRDGINPDQTAALAQSALESERPMAYIKERRNPGLTALSQKFDEIVGVTLGNSGVGVSAPPYFEGDAFTVSFSFSSQAELKRRIAALHKLEDASDKLEELL